MPNSLINIYKKVDEYYTPPILVEPIIKHLNNWLDKQLYNRKPIILCPFDTIDSEFVIALSKLNDFEVKYGHISTGQDFFTYDYGHYDIIISNPPFSHKKEIFSKLLKANIPFALICNMMIINYQEIANLFSDYKIQILAFDKKVSFNGNTTSFASGYFCNNFLCKDLLFEKLANNNTGKHFTASKMLKICTNN